MNGSNGALANATGIIMHIPARAMTTQYVKGLVKQQKDQPLSASSVDSVDSLRSPFNRVRRSVTR